MNVSVDECVCVCVTLILFLYLNRRKSRKIDKYKIYKQTKTYEKNEKIPIEIDNIYDD